MQATVRSYRSNFLGALPFVLSMLAMATIMVGVMVFSFIFAMITLTAGLIGTAIGLLNSFFGDGKRPETRAPRRQVRTASGIASTPEAGSGVQSIEVDEIIEAEDPAKR